MIGSDASSGSANSTTGTGDSSSDPPTLGVFFSELSTVFSLWSTILGLLLIRQYRIKDSQSMDQIVRNSDSFVRVFAAYATL